MGGGLRPPAVVPPVGLPRRFPTPDGSGRTPPLTPTAAPAPAVRTRSRRGPGPCRRRTASGAACPPPPWRSAACGRCRRAPGPSRRPAGSGSWRARLPRRKAARPAPGGRGCASTSPISAALDATDRDGAKTPAPSPGGATGNPTFALTPDRADCHGDVSPSVPGSCGGVCSSRQFPALPRGTFCPPRGFPRGRYGGREETVGGVAECRGGTGAGYLLEPRDA